MPKQLLATFAVALFLLFNQTALFADEPSSIKLSDLLTEAEKANPMLAARRSAYEAAKERISQAGAFDNPMIGIGVENLPVDSFAFDREEMTGKTLELSQSVPFFGKRELRRQAARYEADAVEAEYMGQALMLRSGVKLAFFDLYSIQKSLQTVEKNIDLMDTFKKVTESRYSVGKGMLKDVIKSQVEISMLFEKRIDLQREEQAKRAYLASLLGRETPVVGEVEDIRPTEITLDREAIVAQAVLMRPAVAAASSKVEVAKAKAGLAYRERYPDFSFKVNYMQRDKLEGGMDLPDMVSAMVSVDLPVWYGSKLNPMVREAAAEQAMAASERDAVLVETRAKIYTMASEIEQSDRMLKLYKDVLIPQANDDVGAGLAAYETGGGDFLMLLDSRRTLFDLELSYYKTLAMREKAVAELGAMAGKEF
jgi:outer membrane protein TolC